ncbi:MAG: serine hydrolase [Bacteroidia bacterium]|nr:serine hydrolase [Bacteroidia bacterium]
MFFLLFGGISFAQAPKKLKTWAVLADMDGERYQQKYEAYKNSGFRLAGIDGYAVKGKIKFTAIWKKGKVSDFTARHGMSGAEYSSEFKKKKEAGFRLIHIDGYNANGKAAYAAIWKRFKNKPGPRPTFHGMSEEDFFIELRKQQKAGFRMLQASVFSLNGKPVYSAIWGKGNAKAQSIRHKIPENKYQLHVNNMAKEGAKLIYAESYSVGGKVFYLSIHDKVKGLYAARHLLNIKNLSLQTDNHYFQGYAPVSIRAHQKNGRSQFTAIYKNVSGWKLADTRQLDKKVCKVMDDFNIPGASIAIVKDGRLVYAKGYGYGNREKKEIASASSLYRIASISKPITAAAILKLTEDTNLTLQSKVFGRGAVLGNTYGSEAYGKREKEINVQNLLEHRAGANSWDNNLDPNPSDGPEDSWGAPMFQEFDKNKKELIGWVLDTRNPSHQVNTVTAYSNFAYCVLGRIIEKKSGMGYEKYVKNKILKPCGITDMQIASNSKEKRAYKEVVYYDADGDPYSLRPRRMDSHGGWIASTVDLARFAVRVDGQAGKKDILSRSSTTAMQSSSYGGIFGKGWNLSDGNVQHGGRMSGTRANLKMMSNGVYYVFLVNRYDEPDKDPINRMNNAIEKGISEIKEWPNIDLF